MAQQSPDSQTSAVPFQPVDGAARRDIGQRLDETLFVEASAGTGKTTSLVERMVNLVVTGRTTLDRIAAITFTEAAAAELRDRVRQRLEEAAVDEARPESEQELCRQGVSDLDQATIRTLHSFAAQLLHERPLEAGLPPGFDTSDEIVAGIKFDEAWNEWLDSVLDDNSVTAPHISLALTLNVTLAQLKALAREFHDSYADLPGVVFTSAAPTIGAAGRETEEKWPEAERLCQLSKNGPGDPLYDRVQSRAVAVRALANTSPGDLRYYRQLRRLLPLSYDRGRQSNWATDPDTGQNACTALKALLADLQETVTEELEDAKRHALCHILTSLSRFMLEYADRRKEEGRAEFQDLLVWARDMLRDNLEVRDYFRRRFTHLLIDESQDTDPIQAEIAMFLAEAAPEGLPRGERPRSWHDVLPEPGKLFVVGDPKQSIYRFRRADVEQMQALQGRMQAAGGRTVSLVQNFRSQRPIITWVNHLFQQWMGDGGGGESLPDGQTPYEAMDYRWSADTGSPVGPRVWALADETNPGPAAAIRRQEAGDIAALVRQIVDRQWLKLDREAASDAGGEKYKPVSWSDICVLIRARTSLATLERGLESANIPYRLESASLIFETQEVRDLLNCLRAIDNPADRVATVAALRSPAFGCSDVDLLKHYESARQFDYLDNAARMGDGPVAEGLAELKNCHDRRLWESPATLIERFVRDRLLMEAATGHPRMREQWRRYRFMVERAWQFAEAGGNSLRAFIAWIDDQISERLRVTETPVPESDEESVRVMTIHAAKGLEFPVVILTGLNAGPNNSAGPALFNRQQGSVEVSIGPSGNTFSTAGYQALAEREKQMSGAELVRLMYVATTRARDHLVLSLRRPQRGGNTPAHIISGYLADRSELWEPVLLNTANLSGQTLHDNDQDEATPLVTVAEHSVAARDIWVEQRRDMIATQGRPSFVSATGLGHVDDDDKPEPVEDRGAEPWRRGRAGTSVGRAVHAVLQSIDLATGDGLHERAIAQATAEGIPDREDEVARLARVAVESDIVRRAVAAGRLWREVPVAAPVGDGFLHGFIDLLFEEPDGLVMVDYKTDSVPLAEVDQAVERYRLQGGAYACAMSRATGKTIKEVRFLYLQPRRDVVLSDLDGAVREAEKRARERLAVSPT